MSAPDLPDATAHAVVVDYPDLPDATADAALVGSAAPQSTVSGAGRRGAASPQNPARPQSARGGGISAQSRGPGRNAYIAAYRRASTDAQESAVQVRQVEELAEKTGINPASLVWFVDEAVHGWERRPELERLMDECRRGRVRVLYVWALDRLGRDESLAAIIGRVEELDRLGVTIRSVEESWIDTPPDSPVRALLLLVFGWVAQHERRRLRARTLAGIDHARRKGKRLGRPPVPQHLLEQAAAKAGELGSIRAAAAAMGRERAKPTAKFPEGRLRDVVPEAALRRHLRKTRGCAPGQKPTLENEPAAPLER